MSEESTRELLTATLQVAVPLAIREMKDWDDDIRMGYARGWGQYIAEHGDIILYRSGKKGESAKAFAVLARGLGALAYQPGGVTFLGEHFCTDHALCEAAAKAVEREELAS